MKLRAFKAASVLALVLSFSLSAQAAKPVYAKKAVGYRQEPTANATQRVRQEMATELGVEVSRSGAAGVQRQVGISSKGHQDSVIL